MSLLSMVQAAGALSAASRGGQGRGLSALIEGGMTMTEMQDRIVELDKAVSEERSEKKKLQIYVDRCDWPSFAENKKSRDLTVGAVPMSEVDCPVSWNIRD